MSGEARALAAVIAWHEQDAGWFGGQSWRKYGCSCDWSLTEDRPDTEADWYDHLAGVVLAWVAEAFAGEREAVVRAIEGADSFFGSTDEDCADAVTSHLLAALGCQEADRGISGGAVGDEGAVVALGDGGEVAGRLDGGALGELQWCINATIHRPEVSAALAAINSGALRPREVYSRGGIVHPPTEAHIERGAE